MRLWARLLRFLGPATCEDCGALRQSKTVHFGIHADYGEVVDDTQHTYCKRCKRHALILGDVCGNCADDIREMTIADAYGRDWD